MKLYKVRIVCPCFDDVVVTAESEEDAKEKALSCANIDCNEFKFDEFLPIEKGDRNKVRS